MEFSKEVKEYVENYTEGYNKLAKACQVGVSTVSRWAKGLSTPGPDMQKYVLSKIETLSNDDFE